jgi:1,2-diacylglycerol 3-alpha-glucosyltransferase
MHLKPIVHATPAGDAIGDAGEGQRPLVIVSSYPPRRCGIATFTEEALEFIRRHMPERPIHIVSHTDGQGPNVHPVLDQRDPAWPRTVADTIIGLQPYVVHLEHEYGLYETVVDGRSDNNAGFLRLLEYLNDAAIPSVVETHTVHGRYTEAQAWFLRRLIDRCTILLLKCDYQRWRMEWNFQYRPDNVRVVPHGARPDKLHLDPETCKIALGLSELVGHPVLGLIGWIQQNKRWDLILDQWESLREEVRAETGTEWMLLAAGNMRDPHDTQFFLDCRTHVRELERKGVARYVEFDPRGDRYYEIMACCDVVALPSLDETQSGTLARIIALAKPYITTAPMEGLTSQTVESEAGLLFSNAATLRRGLKRLMTDAALRQQLSANARVYLQTVVSWDIVVEQYLDAYAEAAARMKSRAEAAIAALDEAEPLSMPLSASCS